MVSLKSKRDRALGYQKTQHSVVFSFKELFSDIGPIKDAKFIDKGVAEVIYVNLDDAYSAIKKYDRKELDGKAFSIQSYQVYINRFLTVF